ncbi:hypothetical protein IAE33_003805 [Pseudomonas sp. S60]|uniref:hypothetical protein n=1 Tax=Pseudomonas sp. S60 TaxID=211124 RepID=UPI001913A386|nr:hypothetical protein [Pseudomonas sp. S60]MBK5011945.1 hypothetical protein [Pseudomonas sp. S60]
MNNHLILQYGAEVFVTGGFKICIRQIQEDTQQLLVFDDEQIDGLIIALQRAQQQARHERKLDIKQGGEE